MTDIEPELRQLRRAASIAYERVRAEIVDLLPPPAVIDASRLDLRQRQLLLDLARAEHALAQYRARVYP